jgi:hypothetical protein
MRSGRLLLVAGRRLTSGLVRRMCQTTRTRYKRRQGRRLKYEPGGGTKTQASAEERHGRA